MISISEVYDWILFHKSETLIISLLVVGITYKLIKKYKNREIPVIKSPTPTQQEKSIPSLPKFDDPFNEVDEMEERNIANLKNLLMATTKDYEDNVKAFEEAKIKYKELEKMGIRLKHHIPILRKQKENLEIQIKELEAKKIESNAHTQTRPYM